MPTEIRTSSASSVARSKTPRLGTATIALTLAFAAFHLVSGFLIERSHASPVFAPAFAAASDAAICAMEASPPQPEQPYD